MAYIQPFIFLSPLQMADFGNADSQIITPSNYECYDLLCFLRRVLLQNNRLLVGFHFCDTFCYAIF